MQEYVQLWLQTANSPVTDVETACKFIEGTRRVSAMYYETMEDQGMMEHAGKVMDCSIEQLQDAISGWQQRFDEVKSILSGL